VYWVSWAEDMVLEVSMVVQVERGGFSRVGAC